jgi:hypothetical protein
MLIELREAPIFFRPQKLPLTSGGGGGARCAVRASVTLAAAV